MTLTLEGQLLEDARTVLVLAAMRHATRAEGGGGEGVAAATLEAFEAMRALEVLTYLQEPGYPVRFPPLLPPEPAEVLRSAAAEVAGWYSALVADEVTDRPDQQAWYREAAATARRVLDAVDAS